MPYVKWMLGLLLSLVSSLLTSPSYAVETDAERNSRYLNSLNLEELMNVEVTLDEVFDVFGGLLKAKTVTVATGAKQSTAHAPAVTTVITAQDIEAMGASDLDEVLETVPGLHVTKNASMYASSYTIRGLYSGMNPEVLVLINGIPMKLLQFGSRGITWLGMPIHAIARLEIIRGPGSAIYGADAFAGVINIITKNSKEIDGTEAGLRIGSFDTEEGWLLHGGQWADFDLAATLQYYDTAGHRGFIEEDAQTQYDKQFGTHASFAPAAVNVQRRNWDGRLELSRGPWKWRGGYEARRNLGMGASATQVVDPNNGTFTDDRWNTDLIYHNPHLTEQWDVTAQLSYLNAAYDGNARMFPPGAFGGAYPNGMLIKTAVTEAQTYLDMYGFYSGFQQHRIRLGLGYQNLELSELIYMANYGINPATGQPIPPGSALIDLTDTRYAFLPEGDRQVWYMSLQDEWYLADDWELTAGLRYDNYSDFGKTINPRLALVWQVRPELTTKFLYGRAFRAPSFGELRNTNNPSQLGNAGLDPEIIQTWEWAADYRVTNHLHFTANLFSYALTEKILYVPDPNGQGKIAQNVGEWQGQGLELEARWKMTARSSVLFNYAFAKVIDKNTDYNIGHYPRHSAYLRADYLVYPDWYLNLSTNWIADRKRSYGDPRPEIADYTTVDLTLRYKDIRQGHSNLAIGVRNLFDVDAREPSLGPNSSGMISIPEDLPLAKRNWFMEFRYRF